MTPDLSKLPPLEDANQNGLSDQPSISFWLWVTDALTAFINGCWGGVKPGVVVGGVFAANSDTTDAATLAAKGGLGAGSAILAVGLAEFSDFHRKNPMPNPVRPSKL